MSLNPVHLNDWLVCLKSHPDRPTLIVFPYAGAGVTSFYQWAAPLLDRVQVVVVHLPGRETRMREPLMTHWKPVCEAIAVAIEDLDSGPFGFFGHSMGSLLAFETCRLLQEQGRTLPGVLVTSGRAAAHLPSKRPRSFDLPSRELFALLHEMGGLRPELLEEPVLMNFIEPIVRADLQINDQYDFSEKPPLPVPLVALAGRGDRQFSVRDVHAWRELSSGATAVHEFDGDHFFIESARNEVSALLYEYLNSYCRRKDVQPLSDAR